MKPAPRLTDLPAPPRNRSGWPWTEEAPQLPDSMPDGGEWPLVSIVTPSYNQGHYIEKAIRSVLLQGYPKLEYAVIDGGSVDQTIDIIKNYEPWLTYWVSESDHGQADAINKGFARTSGTIMNWLNSDDFLERNALMWLAMTFCSADANVGAIVGMGSWVDVYGRTIPLNFPSAISRKTLLQWCISEEGWFLQPACFFTRDAWEFAGPLMTNLRYCMDVALHIKMSERFQFALLSTIIAHAARHPNAKTVAEIPYAEAETALFFATLPDGFDQAKAVMNKLIEGRLAAQAPLAVFERELRRLARAAGLGQARNAFRRLTGNAASARSQK
jgi:hypothetical protein